jgi:hypothetical protein
MDTVVTGHDDRGRADSDADVGVPGTAPGGVAVLSAAARVAAQIDALWG